VWEDFLCVGSVNLDDAMVSVGFQHEFEACNRNPATKTLSGYMSMIDGLICLGKVHVVCKNMRPSLNLSLIMHLFGHCVLQCGKKPALMKLSLGP
jgi:hypothetical protein